MRLGKMQTGRRVIAGVAMIGLLAPLWGFGFAKAQTLDQIRKRGTIIVGIRVESPPWGFIDKSDQVSGFDADVARAVAKHLDVTPDFARVAIANRIPQLLTGKVDIVAAILGMYPDRAKVIQFSEPYSVVDIVVLGAKETPIATLDDLKSLHVGVPRGSAQDTAITKNAPAGTQIQRFDDDVSTMQALVAGQVDAIGANNTFLSNIEQVAPGKFDTKLVVTRQYNGIGIRQNEPDMLKAINAAIDQIRADGELNAISQKWLKQDIPTFPKEVPGIPFADH